MTKRKTCKQITEEYLKQTDWRVRENSNSPFSYGGLCKHQSGEVSKDYWLNEVYSEEVREAHTGGLMHIHDLGGLTLYCCGYSLENILQMGVQGIPNVPTSSPAQHFDSALNQIANLVTIFQNEIMGAVALNSFDTLLAPYVAQDELSYKQVKQHIQNFIYSVNSNSRGGAEPAFLNITCDLTPSADLLDKKAFWYKEYYTTRTYKDFQKEMDMINRAICEIMIQGDAKGVPFAYPIITYNIHKRFDWDNPNNDLLWEMTGKFGYPYFANYINSDMNPEDARSMCCRLRLSVKELQRKNGGLFGSGDSTGSIGVVTLNLPRIAYLSDSFEEFFENLREVLEIAKDSLETKRKYLNENILKAGLLPAFSTYVGTLKNHFSTIGVVGMNEMCLNFLHVDIADGKSFALQVGQFIRDTLQEFQNETGNLYNYEATPAESTAYKLALMDKNSFGNTAYTQGTEEAPYYTNSCHLPVNHLLDIHELLEHQEQLQEQFTGGTVVHLYLGQGITGAKAKHLVKILCERYKVPYISLSPIIYLCSDHGYTDATEKCPICGKEVEKMQRITGYLRNVKYFNDGKRAEFNERKQYSTNLL